VNRVAECRAPFGRRAHANGDRLKRVAGGYLRVTPLVDVRPDALHGRDTGVTARGFEAVEARAIDRLERKLVLKTGLGAGIELARRDDRALAIQVRAVALETQGPSGSNGSSGSGGSGRSHLAASRLALQRLATGGTKHLRASAFQLATRKANPLILYKLTVFLRHGSQSNCCL
jgi:hypothetical protein